MTTSEMNLQIDHFIAQYLKNGIKQWLGNAKKVLVVGTKPIYDKASYSLSVRSVLEADGKNVEYLESTNSHYFDKIYSLLRDRYDVKTIFVENNKKNIGQIPIRLARDLLKGSEYYNPNSIRIISSNGVFTPEQVHSLYLIQILNRKYTHNPL